MSDHKHDDHHHHDHEHCDHDHDHDHEHDHKVVLIDENGEEKTFEIVTWFELDSKEYVVLVSPDGDQEGVILRVEVEEGEEILVDIEDEAEWEKVLATYEKLLEQENE